MSSTINDVCFAGMHSFEKVGITKCTSEVTNRAEYNTTQYMNGHTTAHSWKYLGTVSQFEPCTDTRSNQHVDKHELPLILDIDGAAVGLWTGAVPRGQRPAHEVLLKDGRHVVHVKPGMTRLHRQLEWNAARIVCRITVHYVYEYVLQHRHATVRVSQHPLRSAGFSCSQASLPAFHSWWQLVYSD